MKFFHVYNEKYFDGLVKNNLINSDTGFKLQHCFAMPFDQKFNEIAQPDGKLHNLLKGGEYAFYVDRITGGITWHTYAFDKNLIKMYQELLGDNFLGFQLHESCSNRRNNWDGMRTRLGDAPYDVEWLKEKTRSSYAKLPDGTPLYGVNTDPIEYFATHKYPETYQEAIADFRDMFRRRMDEVDGLILPCDSAFQAQRMQNELGMKTFMPEVGYQIPQMRQEVALTRGIAENNGKTWGVYYETWSFVGNWENYSIACYNNEPGNEWYLSQEEHPDDFTTYGENGGSSRLLQDRIYHYALMAGAHYVSEEWGLNCSYSDMKEFILSPYGIVKKNFIDFAHKLGKIKAKVPFAIVLPTKYEVFEIGRKIEERDPTQLWRTYLRTPLDDEDAKYFTHIFDVKRYIYGRTNPIGNEGRTITNSRFGDLFDIIYADAGQDVFNRYEALIDISPDSSFARSGKAGSVPVFETTDLEAMEAGIKELAKKILPCTVDKLMWVLSDGEDGTQYLSIFNNEGNDRTPQNGDNISPEADARATVTFKDAGELKVVKSSNENITLRRVDEKTWCVDMPATSFVILSY